MNQPCDHRVFCPCDDDPIANLSAEAPDVLRYRSIKYWGNTPPNGWHWSRLSCAGLCYSEVSQEDADFCAQRAAEDCVYDGEDDGETPYEEPIEGDGYSRFYPVLNSAQSCTVTCPESAASFTATTPAGRIYGRSTYEANFYAYVVACQEASRKRICLTKSCVPTCVGSDLNCAVFANSDSPGRWQVYGLPAWAHYHESGNVLLLQGTATAPGNTDIVVIFTTVPGMNYASIAFQIQVLGLSNPTALPACDYGIAYSYQMIGIGGSGPPYEYGLAGGSLPNGLSISPSGLISGIPLLCEDGSFSIFVMDEEHNSCTQNFTMAVSFPPAGLNVYVYGLEQWYSDLVPFGYPADMHNLPILVPTSIWELSISSMGTSFTQRVTLNSPGANDVMNLTWTYGPSEIAVWQKDKTIHPGSPFGTYLKTNEVPPAARNPASIYVAPM